MQREFVVVKVVVALVLVNLAAGFTFPDVYMCGDASFTGLREETSFLFRPGNSNNGTWITVEPDMDLFPLRITGAPPCLFNDCFSYDGSPTANPAALEYQCFGITGLGNMVHGRSSSIFPMLSVQQNSYFYDLVLIVYLLPNSPRPTELDISNDGIQFVINDGGGGMDIALTSCNGNNGQISFVNHFPLLRRNGISIHVSSRLYQSDTC